ncbi:cytochrome aa3 quinol oxidase subunit II [Alicyclobacillus tolerans]|uniref:cytochrome aa3 quinol oxidase subunit II n=1 Tax=Alicyclobacillus tolerans TaxID=90970 RepID=UPI001F02B369|nr:cytochrome aa3 quinol oxidase subunit II [Alicyclobacillus tolerans]MCF8568456.1 cytochrome aa3 quinol oxidase subunit II [Alicyclobacillus tolerans]
MQHPKRFGKILLASLLPILVLAGCGQQIQVLHPAGPVAKQEFNLIVWSFVLMFLVVLAVFVLFGYVIVKYRAKPENEGYQPPDVHGNKKLETIWTVIPILVVVALAIPTVATTYRLQSPPKSATKNPLVIDVTSADWKWLFSYPQQGIETVNYVVIPAGQPVKFQLNAIGPMNSFWVPQLGGMEMNMPGKELGLWLQANKAGDYLGRSANFSGKGFVHMTFHVLSKPEHDFGKWVQQVKSTAPPLSQEKYQSLLQQGTVGQQTYSTNAPPPKPEMQSMKM